MLDLDELEKLLAEATPGPWDVGERDGGMGWDVFQVNGDDLPQPRLRGMFGHQPDAEFIAHAPADLQWCLARIAALETAARHVPRPGCEGGVAAIPEFTSGGADARNEPAPILRRVRCVASDRSAVR